MSKVEWLNLSGINLLQKMGMVAERSKLVSQIQAERMPYVPGLNPVWGMNFYMLP